MAGNSSQVRTHLIWRMASLVAIGLLLWTFPPFRIVRFTHDATARGDLKESSAFDAAAAASKIWSEDIPAAADRASDLGLLARALRSDPVPARAHYARQAGLGASYYFVRGSGRVLTREGSRVRVALDDAELLIVELRLGPVFGNTVRDGCGLLNVNSFPGLQEFNALAGELNALVEKQVLPMLREKAVPGAKITFAACAEATEAASDPTAPLLILIPVKAEVH